jgi:hypothetical protein
VVVYHPKIQCKCNQSQRSVGLGSYGTAWSWLHKLRRSTICYGRQKLSGNVEVDEIYFGSQNSRKRGRGAGGKSGVLAAVEKKKPRKLGRIRLQLFPDCSSNSINTFLQQYLDEYVFRFNRRKSKTAGKKFFRIVQQAMDSINITFEQITLPVTTDNSLAN